MDSLLNRLRRALLQGTALAAATVAAGCSDDDTSEQPSDAAVSSDAGNMKQDATVSAELVPYPSERLGCFGEDRGDGPGYHGFCCVTAHCYTPADGVCSKSPALSAAPTGSGTCACSGTAGGLTGVGSARGVEGPYLPNPEHQAASGSCCYLVASIKCDGRPLIVEDRVILADLTQRGDWTRFG